MSGLYSCERARRNFAVQNARRAALRDLSIPDRYSSNAKRARVDLGLELLMLHARPGVPLTQDDIACWCGVTTSAVYVMEKRALKKLANRVCFGPLAPLFREYFAA